MNLYKSIWYTSIVLAIIGVLFLLTGQPQVGITLATVGGSSLALFVIWDEIQRASSGERNSTTQLALTLGGATLFITTVAFSTNVIPSEASISVRVVTLVLGLQALALTLENHPATISLTARLIILCAGHGAVLAGSVLLLPFGPTNTPGGLLLYAAGVPTLLLHAFWIRTYRSKVGSMSQTNKKRWEGTLLITIIIGVPSVLIFSLTGTGEALVPSDVIATLVLAVTGITTILGVGIISAPQTSPWITQLFERHIVAVTLHTLATLILVNITVFAIFLIVPQLFLPILSGILVVILVGVVLNYSMIFHAQRSSFRDYNDDKKMYSETSLSDVTVVITGFDEAAVLPETLKHNLTELEKSPFVLVPAMRSTDGTIELMKNATEVHPERVRVIEGTTGSKAGDLNRVWQYIETPYVLVLDADETIGADFVRRGLIHFNSDPSVGIVQGRKIASSPTVDAFQRFVTIERQHSTLLDDSLMDDIFGAGHFAGSSAMFRHEVPIGVSGWDPSFLTEDIELTLRIYTQTKWNLKYDANMISQEINPKSWGALVRQRERWARGWAQVAVVHERDVLQSWRHIGGRKAGGLSWLLFTSVSAPIFTILPALSLHWYLGLAPQTSAVVALIIALVLLPERGISFVYTAIRDPEIETSAGRTIESLLFAYTWILFSWLVQLHSLYLELSGTENVWHRTKKESATGERISGTE